MHTSALAAMIALLLVGGAACKKDPAAATGSASAGAGAPGKATTRSSGGSAAAAAAAKAAAQEALQVSVPAGLAGFGMSKLVARLQGDWLVRGVTLRRAHAWHVAGRKVSVYDGVRQKEYQLSVMSPCSIKLSRKVGGGTTSTISVVAFDSQTLYAGLGGAAVSHDGAWAACLSGKTFTLRANKCLQWKRSMFRDELKIVAGECSVAKKKGGKVFRAKIGGRLAELPIFGSVAMTQQKRRAPAEKVDSFETAKMKARTLAR